MKNKITTLILVMMCSLASMAQVGIGTNSPNTNAALDVVSTTQGILFPRMTETQRDNIISPAEGLTIFNTTTNAMQTNISTIGAANWKNWSNGFEDNTTCTTKVISVTSCASVTGTTLNDDANTADGTEYDWTGATSFTLGTGFGAPSNTRALVEIGGQCWAKFNMNIASASNSWCYNNTSCNTDGRLYNWSGAMNGSTTERAQGVCPTGWHVPSDCEWMYLENTLGMSTTDQQLSGTWRNSGNVGTKLKSSGSSGFTALLAGYRISNGTFSNRGTNGYWWSSSETSATLARRRGLDSSQAGVYRYSSYKTDGFSVRCLKD